MTLAAFVLMLVTAERLAELWLARRNTVGLLSKGAFEVAPRHYPAIVVMHATWLVGLWILGFRQPVIWGWLVVFLALQVLRLWILSALGERWTTRIIVYPDALLVSKGPYRFLSHPNYIVVIGEIATLPLSLGLPLFALIFSVANAIVLTIRIRAENAALKELRNDASD